MSTIEEKKAEMARRREALKQAQAAPQAEDAKIMRPTPQVKPEDVNSRLRIVFDNSGSMDSPLDYNRAGSKSKLEEAKGGVVEFIRNLTPNKDALAIHMLERPDVQESDYYDDSPYSSPFRVLALPPLLQEEIMSTDLILLASNIASDKVRTMGSTPLIETIDRAIEASPKATRIVAFSDGAATGIRDCNPVCKKAKAQGIPVDTVYFGAEHEQGAILMKQIAELTGGIFLVFDPAKGVKFSEALKYLTPGKRLMLMNEEFKAKLQRGEVK